MPIYMGHQQCHWEGLQRSSSSYHHQSEFALRFPKICNTWVFVAIKAIKNIHELGGHPDHHDLPDGCQMTGVTIINLDLLWGFQKYIIHGCLLQLKPWRTSLNLEDILIIMIFLMDVKMTGVTIIIGNHSWPWLTTSDNWWPCTLH